MLFAVDFAAQLGDMVFLVDEARGGIVDSEIQLAMSFPVSDKAEESLKRLAMSSKMAQSGHANHRV